MTDNKPVRIIRAAHEKAFFVFSRKTAQDVNLSYEALGVLAYLLSKPDSWQANVRDIAKRSSEYKVYKILRELRKAGYLTLEKESGKGRFSQWVYQVFEMSQLSENQQVEKQHVENQHTKRIQKNSDNTEGMRKSASTTKALPANRKSWTWDHIEQYATEHNDIENLAKLYDSGFAYTLKRLPTKAVALDCIELYEEMKRNSKDDFNGLWLKTTFKPEYNPFKCMLWALPNWLVSTQKQAVKPPSGELSSYEIQQRMHQGMEWDGQS